MYFQVKLFSNLISSLFIFSGKPEVVRLLVENGTHVNAENNLKRTPLFEAAVHGINLLSNYRNINLMIIFRNLDTNGTLISQKH